MTLATPLAVSRHWLAAAIVVLLIASTLPASAADAPTKPRYNVLFLMSDDLRPELGCYGGAALTPNLDKLAAAGVRFERAYVQYPLCNPSRTSMLTGRHPTTTGVLDNNTWFGAAHRDWLSLPKFFKQNGYAALRTGKIFHGGIDDADAWTEGAEPRKFEGAVSEVKRPPNRAQLSDRVVVLDGDGQSHGDYAAADRAIAYLEKYKDQPFLLCCGFTKPHSPPSAPQKFLDLYDPAKLKLPVDFEPRPTTPAGFPPGSVTPNGDLFIGRDASPEEARRYLQAYLASASWMDWNVGRVLEALDRSGLRDRTVVVFWGDHGYHLGEKGKWSKHGSLFEIGTRVPLIVYVPGAKGNGSQSPRIVQSLDIYPTLAELCGLTPPAGLEGASLAPLLEDPNAARDRPAFTRAFNNQKLGLAVRTERWRYAEYGANGAEGAMLFDEQADPHEMKNLADDPAHSQTRAELAKLLDAIRPRP